MKIIVDGRRVGRENKAYYNECTAYFKKRGLNKRNVLHEFYHHLIYVYNLGVINNIEGRDANRYSKIVLDIVHG